MGGRTPKPDARMGEAAVMSARTGEQYLEWMKAQGDITNEWAQEDRSRWRETFRPIEDQWVQESANWDTPERRQMEAGKATADVWIQARQGEAARTREAMAMGVNPASGRFQGASARAGTDTALAAVGAGNLARRQVAAEGEARMANVINLGKGMAVNPATSMGLSNSAISSGANGALQGYNQAASIYGQQYNQQMQAHQANQNSMAGLFGAVGTVAGMLSSKRAKTNRKPVGQGKSLNAVRKMPIDEWDYKPGKGDGGHHIGTYAEDFQRATGQGDGRTIDIPSAIGITMGAIKDLDAKVDRLSRGAK